MKSFLLKMAFKFNILKVKWMSTEELISCYGDITGIDRPMIYVEFLGRRIITLIFNKNAYEAGHFICEIINAERLEGEIKWLHTRNNGCFIENITHFMSIDAPPKEEDHDLSDSKLQDTVL